MKKIALVLAVMLSSGCMSYQKDLLDKTLAGYTAYIQQERTGDLITLKAAEGESLKWSVTGASEITFATPLPPLAGMPKVSEGTATKIADKAGNVALGLGGFWMMRDVLSRPAPRPEVVRPEVIIME